MLCFGHARRVLAINHRFRLLTRRFPREFRKVFPIPFQLETLGRQYTWGTFSLPIKSNGTKQTIIVWMNRNSYSFKHIYNYFSPPSLP